MHACAVRKPMITKANDVLSTKTMGVSQYMVFRHNRRNVRREAYLGRDWIAIDRGVYLDWKKLSLELGRDPTLLEAGRIVALARLHCTAYRFGSRDHIILTSSSGLLALGFPVFNINPDVTLRREGNAKSYSSLLPAVTTPAGHFSGVRIRVLEGGLADASPQKTPRSGWEGFRVADPAVVVADLVRTGHPMQAYSESSILFSAHAAYSKFQTHAGTERHVELKGEVLEFASKLKGTRGSKRLLEIVQHADFRMDSIYEASLLWMVKCWLKDPFLTDAQHLVQAHGQQYFIDVTVPSLREGFEFDGRAKLGGNQTDWDLQSKKFLERQTVLAAANWWPQHFTFADIRHPERALRRIGATLAKYPERRPRPGGKLWSPFD